MTETEKKRIVKKITNLFEDWRTLMGLGNWSFTYNFLDSVNTHDDGISMSIASAWEYQMGDVNIHMPTCAMLDDQRLEESVIHELCHALIHELTQKHTPKQEERVVTSMARAYQWVRDAGR